MTQTQEQNVPDLRFPEFVGDWETDRLSESGVSVVDGDRGANYPQKRDFSQSGYCLFLNAKNVTKTGFSFVETAFISQEKDTAMSKGKLNRGDLLLTTRGSVGHIALFDYAVEYDVIRINSGMVILRVTNSGNSSSFHFFLLNSPKVTNQIKRTAFGSAQPQLTVKEIKRFWLSKPSLPEQQKIASFLSSVDGKIEQLGKKKALLEQYKKGMMQKLFSQDLRFKDSQGNHFPAWEEKRLGEVAEPPSYGMNAAAISFDGSHKYIRITDIDEDSRKFKPSPLTSPAGKITSEYKMTVGDILFARTGASTGRSYIYKPDDGDVYFAGFLIRFRISKAHPQFVFFTTLTRDFEKWVVKMSMRSGQPGINAKEFSRYPINIPCLAEQQKIADFLSSIDRKIDLVSTELNHAKTFKKGLLQQMFV